jgi:cell division protein FtsW (lipid II flippase)
MAALAGAIGSVALTLYTGRHNDSRVLMAIFTFWVISPFIVLLIAAARWKRWTDPTRAALFIVALLLSLISLAIYGNVALGPPRAKLAFVFVVVPPASWLLIAIVVLVAALVSRHAPPQ